LVSAGEDAFIAFFFRGLRSLGEDDLALRRAYEELDLPIIESRVDWVSCSCRPGFRALDLGTLAAACVADEEAA